MRVSNEEFFMYLTIALIVLVPLGARLYRRLTMKRTAAMLRDQFGKEDGGGPGPSGST
ncbi:hypothetical protein YTPLAS18_12180 [Nitrospira sp.]|nr:hypothetical protein YTPLAS18_12180 [Nitrospira sp.]